MAQEPQKTLSPNQEKFVVAMLRNKTIKSAAESCGLSENTGLNYMREPHVRAAVSEALDRELAEVTRQTALAMKDALATLAEIHSDASNAPTARCSAARTILTLGPQMREAQDLSERILRLEKLAKESKRR